MPIRNSRRTFQSLLAAFLALGCWLTLPTGAVAKDSLLLDLAFSRDEKTLVGRAEYSITNDTSTPMDHISMWLYPNRFKRGWETLEDYNVNWLYPAGRSTGEIHILDAVTNNTTVTNRDLTFLPFSPPGGNRIIEDGILEIPLPQPLLPGQSVSVSLGFEVTIPERRGRFGRHKGTVSLAGGFYPMPMRAPDDRRIYPLEVTARITIPAENGMVVADQIFPLGATTRNIEVNGFTSDLPIILMDRMHVSTTTREGVVITHVTSQYQPTQPAWTAEGPPKRNRNGVPGGFKSFDHLDRPGRAAAIAETTLAAHLELGGQAPDNILMVEIPAFDRLVQRSGTTILVANGLWKMVPSEKARSFHDASLALEIATGLALPRAMALENPEQAPLVAEIAANATVQQWQKRTASEKQPVGQLLGFASFIPYVDNLLYAPQIPFKDAYTDSIEEQDIQRDEIWRFNNQLPRGKRVFAKLEDLIGKGETIALVEGWFRETSNFSAHVKDAIGTFTETFYRQWWGSYPEVQYGILKKKSRQNSDGSYTHTVQIKKEGAAVVEPVSVLLTDRGGAQKTVVWDGNGPVGRLIWQSPRPLKSVHVDPRRRLVESARVAHNNHPLSDNKSPLGMRPPLLTQFLIWGDTVTLKPFVYASVSLVRKHDISNSVNLYGMYTPRKVGGSIGYLRHFGKTLTLNAKSFYAGPYLAVYHHKEASLDEPTLPGRNQYTATLATASMLVGMNNRSYLFDPRTGHAFSMSLGYSAGSSADGRTVQNGLMTFKAGKNWSPTPGHNFVLYGGTETRIGTPPASNLATLSHRQMLRGFDLDETYGQASLYGVVEYRHNIFGSTPITFPFGTSLDRVQGVLFAGGGTVSWPGRYAGLFTEDRSFAEAGYGLRIFLLTLGVVPYLLAIDFAVPLYPTDRTYQVKTSTGTTENVKRAPFRFVFGITQTF